jgi:hypothetical protein
VTSLREQFERRLVQLQWSWRELTWTQFTIRVSAWAAVLAVIGLAAWFFFSRVFAEPELNTLKLQLRSGDEKERRRAYDLLAKRTDAAGCYAYALRDDRPEIRDEAAKALSDYQYSITPAVPALIDALEDRDEVESIRCACAYALRHARDRKDKAVPALRRVTLDVTDSINVKNWAWLALRDLGATTSAGESSQSQSSSPSGSS